MKQLLNQALKISILILAVSFLGCDDDDIPDPEVLPGFTYTLNEDTGTVTFINISENSRNYFWTFGDGASSTEINPIKTYANGTYTVTLKATNVAGASATFEDIIIISIPNPITLPVTFDDPNVAYNAATFSGASFEILDNPDVSGTNDKASKVGAITNSGAAFEGVNFNLGTQLDLTANKTISMNFWADAPVDVLMKLEEGTGDDLEVTASHGGTGWEEISFNFNSSNKYVRVTLFVDGPGTTAGTFYIDDIIQIETPAAACTPETTQSLSAADFNLTFQTDPSASIVDADAVLTTVSNPDPDNDINNSCQVGQIDRNGGALFANNQIEFDAKLDFNANAGFKMKVWSPVAGTNVLVKLEDKTNTGINVEVGATTTSAGAWEELTFDFASDQSGKYDRIILFFELNTNTAETYYIDDFMLYGTGGGGGVACTPETTQSLSAADFDLTFQTDPGASIGSFDAVLTTVSNPDFDNALNSSCQVGQIVRNDGALFANNQIEFDAKLDFNANAGFKMKVWSPVAGTNVLVKLEDKTNTGINVEVGATTTSAGAWEELTFDFASDQSGKYDRIILFFELNTNTAETYYIDDFMLYGTGGGGGVACTPETMQSLGGADLNLTFMADPTASVIEDGGDFEWIDNPDFENAVNSSCKVGKITKLGANPWDNNQIDLNAKLDFNANTGLKIKVWSARANTEVRIKLEEIGNSANNTEQFLTTSVTSGWEELTFPFTSADSDKFDKIVIFFDLNANNTDTYYFDDFMLYGTGTGGGGGGGGTCPAPPAGDLISNGDFEAGESCWQLINNGGLVTISSTVSSGSSGSKSGQIRTAPLKNPGIKQERFAVGTASPNIEYTVTFDIKADASTPLVDGAVFQAFVFSEGVDGGTTAASQHVLVQGLGSVSTSWETKTYTFTSGAAAANVEGGFSFLAELVCGGAGTCDGIINIDNVSIKIK